jgi:hypothetical protein
MSNTQPTMLPGGTASAGNGGSSQPTNPTQQPPASASAAKADCGCHDKDAKAKAASAGVPMMPSSMSAPSMLPASAAAGGGVTAAWRNNAKITGMWSINQDRNAWAHLDGIGWRNLAGNSASGIVTLNMLASHAYQTGSVAGCYEEDDGRISQMYVW